MEVIASLASILSDSTMSYFKIYPRKLLVDAASCDCHGARLFFNLEQYGHLHHNKMCPVHIRFDPIASGRWYMVVTQTDIQLKEFDRFMAALNFYLFSVLKYSPSGPRPETPQYPEEYFFQPVFFDAFKGNIQPVPVPPLGKASK
jgi:hypothetical protein